MSNKPKTGTQIVSMNTTVNRKDGKPRQIARGVLSSNLLLSLLRTESTENFEVIKQMEADPQVQLAKRTFQANIRAAAVAIRIPAESGKDERILALQKRLEGLWSMAEKKFGEAIGFGRVAFEVVYTYEPKHNLTYAAAVQDLPFQKTRMVLEEVDPETKGAFRGIRLWSKADEEDGLNIPADKSWWLALDATVTEPHGVSRHAGAPYQIWKRRKMLSEFLDKFIRRYTLRGGTAHLPETVRDETTGQVHDVFEKTSEALEALFSGGYLLLSNERDADGNYLYDFSEAQLDQFNSTPLLDIERKFDSDQLQAYGFPPKTLIEGEATGSFALVTQQALILYAVIEEVLDQFVDSFNKYIVNRHLALNFEPGDEPEILAAYQKMSQRPDALASEIVKMWLSNPQLSPLVLSGAVDVEAVLAGTGIPLSTDFAAKLQEAVRLASSLSPGVGPSNVPPDPSQGREGAIPPAGQGVPGSSGGDDQPDPVDWLGNPVPSVPIAGTPVPPSAAPAGQGVDVAQTALNGAQISSMMEVVTAVTAGQLPAEAAKPILQAAFPSLDPSIFNLILDPLKDFKPAPVAGTEPPAVPPQKPPGPIATLANARGPLNPFRPRGVA